MSEKKRILVIDDDEGILEVVKIILEESGYRVKTLKDATQADRSIDEYKPDLIMMDIWMPKLSGEQLCRRIKMDKNRSNIPIILLSASNRTESISQKCEADDYLAKPFDMEELITKVRQVLD